MPHWRWKYSGRRAADRRRHLLGEIAVLDLVEPPQPVDHPAAARLEEGEAELGVPLHDAALDQRQERHHLLHRMRAGVHRKTRGEAIGARARRSGVRRLVHDDDEAVLRAIGPERVVGGIAEQPPGDRVRADDDRRPAALDREAGMADHRFRLEAGDQGGGAQPRGIGGAEVGDPAVVGVGVAMREAGLAVRHRHEIGGIARQEQRGVDAVAVHRRQLPGGGFALGEILRPGYRRPCDRFLGAARDVHHRLAVHHQIGRQRHQPVRRAQAHPLAQRLAPVEIGEARGEAPEPGLEVGRPQVHRLVDVAVDVEDGNAVAHAVSPEVSRSHESMERPVLAIRGRDAPG